MKKNILFLTLLTLPLLTLAAEPGTAPLAPRVSGWSEATQSNRSDRPPATTCDSSKESCRDGKKPGLEELLSPAPKISAKTEKNPPKSEEPAWKAVDIAAVPEIPAAEKPRTVSFENPGYLLLWLGIIAALYFYLGGIKRKKRAGK